MPKVRAGIASRVSGQAKVVKPESKNTRAPNVVMEGVPTNVKVAMPVVPTNAKSSISVTVSGRANEGRVGFLANAPSPARGEAAREG